MKHDAVELVQSVILDSIADGVFTVDKRWRITSFNRAAERITGISRRDAIGRPCREVFRASICDDGCALRQTCRTGKPSLDRAIYIVQPSGRRVPVSISTAILRDDTGAIIGGVETFRDLSTVQQLHKKLHDRYAFADIIGRSPMIQQLFDVLPQYAESDSTVLIEGDSGTGKELFARAIHHLSRRRLAPFIAVNCAALPDTLLESELFGYKAGAFTDARRDKPGRFALADGGTIFLDEIGDLSPVIQSKLLRILQERVIEPLGSVQSVKVDVRVITATNRNLATLVQRGEFRRDLYYRINVIRLALPRLRERREDIPLLVEHFRGKFNQLQDKHVSGVSHDVLVRLMSHDYPGNIRELENILEFAFVLCHDGRIEQQHLPPWLPGPQESDSGCCHEGLTLRDLEVIHIRDTLQRCNGNRAEAARELGINPSTLFRKLKSLNISSETRRGRRPTVLARKPK
jgi:PAS domain S-box-containing protein